MGLCQVEKKESVLCIDRALTVCQVLSLEPGRGVGFPGTEQVLHRCPWGLLTEDPGGDLRLVGEEARLGKGVWASWRKRMSLWDLKGLPRVGRQ